MHHLRCHIILGKASAAVSYGRAICVLSGATKKRNEFEINQLTFLLTKLNPL